MSKYWYNDQLFHCDDYHCDNDVELAREIFGAVQSYLHRTEGCFDTDKFILEANRRIKGILYAEVKPFTRNGFFMGFHSWEQMHLSADGDNPSEKFPQLRGKWGAGFDKYCKENEIGWCVAGGPIYEVDEKFLVSELGLLIFKYVVEKNQ